MAGAAALGFVALLALGFLPLLGGPGYEAALAAGLLIPSLAAVASALSIAGSRPPNVRLSGRAALGFGVAAGVGLGLMALGVSLLHGARVGYCDASEGVLLMLLGPGFGAVMGGAWGTAAGAWALGLGIQKRRVVVALLAISGPLMGIVLSVWRFYASPSVFAFDPFFGYFAGPLYDTVIDPVNRLVSYRAGSLFTLLAAWAFSGLLSERAGRLSFRYDGHAGRALSGATAAALSLALAVHGAKLSHNTSTASILETLSRQLSHGRCDVHYDPGVVREHVELLARDCHAHLDELEDYFETRGPERVRVLLFAHQHQKSLLMGAANTYIAKPWRAEIYLQPDSYPHPVLRHELAHVVAGSFGQGPFRIAGHLGGWLPDPGRIEGFAEAAAPREDSDFTLREWAAAMQQVGLLPPLAGIFELEFLGHSAPRAYTVAGAFVEWLKDRHGARALRRWYAGETLVSVSGGQSLAQLEQQFRAELERTSISERLRVAAEARFSAPSIFGRRCPHAVDQRYGQAQGLLGALEIQGAEQAFLDVLSLDPNHVGARLGLGQCALRRRDPTRALAIFQDVAGDTRLALGNRLGAREAVANTHFLEGNLGRARQLYEELMLRAASEGHLRNLEVKSLATRAPALEREALSALLLGSYERPPNWDAAAPLLGAFRQREPKRGLPSYLLAKNLYNRWLLDETARYLDEALVRHLELESIEREALRLRVMVGCARSEPARVREALERFLKLPGGMPQQRQAVLAIARRCGVEPAAGARAGSVDQSAAKQ